MWRWLIALLLATSVMACGDGPLYEPGEDRCPKPSLPEGALVSYSEGSSWHRTHVWRFVAFADGRVVVNADIEVRFSPERIATLVRAIEETEITDEDEGCYWPTEEERISDGGGSTLQLRDGDGQHLWSESYPGEPPSELRAATAVCDRFREEIIATGAVPPPPSP